VTAAGADVPLEVLRALAPAGWIRATALIDRALPITGSARGQDARPWFRTLDVVPAVIGHASVATPGAWRAGRWATARFGRDVVDAGLAAIRGPRSRAAERSDALTYEAGGTEAREAFLSRVELESPGAETSAV
jgi:hypothetical protein